MRTACKLLSLCSCPCCSSLEEAGQIGPEDFTALLSPGFARTWGGGGEGGTSFAVAERFPVEINLRDDWLVGNLCLFLGEVLGRHLDTMERRAGKELPNPTPNPGCVLMSSLSLLAVVLVSPPSFICEIRLTPTRRIAGMV